MQCSLTADATSASSVSDGNNNSVAALLSRATEILTKEPRVMSQIHQFDPKIFRSSSTILYKRSTKVTGTSLYGLILRVLQTDWCSFHIPSIK